MRVCRPWATDTLGTPPLLYPPTTIPFSISHHPILVITLSVQHVAQKKTSTQILPSFCTSPPPLLSSSILFLPLHSFTSLVLISSFPASHFYYFILLSLLFLLAILLQHPISTASLLPPFVSLPASHLHYFILLPPFSSSSPLSSIPSPLHSLTSLFLISLLQHPNSTPPLLNHTFPSPLLLFRMLPQTSFPAPP